MVPKCRHGVRLTLVHLMYAVCLSLSGCEWHAHDHCQSYKHAARPIETDMLRWSQNSTHTWILHRLLCWWYASACLCQASTGSRESAEKSWTKNTAHRLQILKPTSQFKGCHRYTATKKGRVQRFMNRFKRLRQIKWTWRVLDIRSRKARTYMGFATHLQSHGPRVP